jgi:BirA family biotin operon repressor/biotin-[acetyl-CoA-carboxylase] ligase
MATHYDIFRLATAESTQDEARSRRDAGGNPALVVASAQVLGRGRQGREWIQPDRGLFASLAFSSDWDVTDRTLIPLVAGVAMRRVLIRHFDIDVGLKWPNDLMVGGAKVGGILVETSDSTIVVGCGVNLWWDDPVDGAGALMRVDPGSEIALALAQDWATELLELLEAGANLWPRTEYEQASVTFGRDVRWGEGEGRAVGLASDGALIVDREGSTIALHSGEVHMGDGGQCTSLRPRTHEKRESDS